MGHGGRKRAYYPPGKGKRNDFDGTRRYVFDTWSDSHEESAGWASLLEEVPEEAGSGGPVGRLELAMRLLASHGRLCYGIENIFSGQGGGSAATVLSGGCPIWPVLIRQTRYAIWHSLAGCPGPHFSKSCSRGCEPGLEP